MGLNDLTREAEIFKDLGSETRLQILYSIIKGFSNPGIIALELDWPKLSG